LKKRTKKLLDGGTGASGALAPLFNSSWHPSFKKSRQRDQCLPFGLGLLRRQAAARTDGEELRQ
jgi:hypothetical protein